MSASGLRLHGDGCVAANTTTRVYTVILEPDCQHAKIMGAEVKVRAASAAGARRFAEQTLNIPRNRVSRVVIPGSQR